ncbi:hypothetical protein [Sphaerisporangium rhizosphaerae]|uniref:Uncharacterized protein n=1 Tax=Sphaerisporangium rhizosphaerae TaxID=2269375 RepID=A0ABW2P556_9ACTN
MTEMNDRDAGTPADGIEVNDSDARKARPAAPGGQDRPRPAGGEDAGPRAVPRDEWFQRREREREDERRDAVRDEWFRRREGDRPRDSRDARGQTADPLGSVAEEARKLFDALQQRVGREVGKGLVKGSVAGLGHGLGQALGGGSGRASGDVWAEAVSGHDDDEYICRACPVCRLKAARREAGGDVTDHLITAGGELLAAFRQAVDAVSRPASPRGAGDTDTRVQHIDLG